MLLETEPKNHQSRTRMQNLTDTDALLGLNLSLTVSPAVTFGTGAAGTALTAEDGKFQLFVDAALQYASLSRILNGFLAGKRFDLSEGLFAKHIVIKNVVVSGTQSNALLLKVTIGGSFSGTLLLNATPAFNADTNEVVLLQLRYDLQTGNLLLKGARMLFANRIEKELKKASRFPVSELLVQIRKTIDEKLNAEWGKGIKGAGTVSDLRLLTIQAVPEHLLMKATCEGSLQITVSEIALKFKR